MGCPSGLLKVEEDLDTMLVCQESQPFLCSGSSEEMTQTSTVHTFKYPREHLEINTEIVYVV